ncbi:hypothetical protein BC629DRAFT_117075 [Irpex lacteus]|nr:hypothetical protein BC629DRAFT_117075 [Irpex lacteus]
MIGQGQSRTLLLLPFTVKLSLTMFIAHYLTVVFFIHYVLAAPMEWQHSGTTTSSLPDNRRSIAITFISGVDDPNSGSLGSGPPFRNGDLPPFGTFGGKESR